MSNKKMQKQKDRKKNRQKNGISGFSTLNQVAGVPKPREHRSSIPVEAPSSIVEPHPTCVYCGSEIENIASAFMVGEESFAHFDCVLERIRESEKPADDQSVSYLGSGTFGLIGKDDEGKPVILRKIPVETPDETKAMKTYISTLRS